MIITSELPKETRTYGIVWSLKETKNNVIEIELPLFWPYLVSERLVDLKVI